MSKIISQWIKKKWPSRVFHFHKEWKKNIICKLYSYGYTCNVEMLSYMYRDANCSFFAVFSTFFELQILVILSKITQNTFFFQGSLCVHFYGNKMKNTVFQAKILFFHPQNTFFFRKRLASLHVRCTLGHRATNLPWCATYTCTCPNVTHLP